MLNCFAIFAKMLVNNNKKQEKIINLFFNHIFYLIMKKIFLLIILTLAAFGVYGQRHVWRSVSAGDATTYALRDDGTLWTCGWNEKGQLGVPSAPERTATWQLTGNDTDWDLCKGAKAYAFFIKKDGTLWAVGSNTSGVQGTGRAVDNKTVVQVGTDDDWASIAAVRFWGYTALAIKKNGSLWGWGNNASYLMGDGTTESHSKPVQIGTDTNWKSVSIGMDHVLALKTDGSLWSWGNSYNGQLGLGNVSLQTSPKQVGADKDWAAVYAIDNRSYAVKADGSLWVCGSNEYGLLGLNQSESDLVQSYDEFIRNNSVSKLGKVLKVTGDENATTFLIGNDGVGSAVYMVGSDMDGALCDGKGKLFSSTVASSDIVRSYVLVKPILPEGLRIKSISSGQGYSMLVTDDGTMYGWGRNKGGQMGENSDLEMLVTSFYKKPIVIDCPQTQISGITDVSLTPSEVLFAGNKLVANELVSNLCIYSVMGSKVVCINQLQGSTDLSELTAGMYVAVYEINGLTKSIKFVVK